MRRSRFQCACLVLVLYCTAFFSNPAQAQTLPAAGGGTQNEHSQILFTVVDKDSNFVALLAEDVRVLQDDKPQEIVALRKLDERPLALAILIDISRSSAPMLEDNKRVADAFVKTVMRPGKDQAGVVTFTGTATVEQDLTNKLDLVSRAIARAEIVSSFNDSSKEASSTALWDAIWATCDELFPPTLSEARRAIILLSNGDDTFSRTKMRDAIERAVKANVAVYSIGIGDESVFIIKKDELRKLSDRTGGRAFFPRKLPELAPALKTIQQELRYQYEITYRSLPGKTSLSPKVRLEIIKPSLRAKDLQISYQRIGLAPAK